MGQKEKEKTKDNRDPEKREKKRGEKEPPGKK